MRGPEMPSWMKMKANIHDLHQAIQNGTEEDVREILDLNTVNINGTVCGTTPLSLSLYREKSAIFKMLLCHQCTKNSLDINKLSKDEKARLEPPLLTACRLGQHDAVGMLVKCGVDLEGKDSFQHTAIWMATRQRYTDQVRFLIDNGASVNPSDVWTHSPLFFAVKYSSKRVQIAKLLIHHGAEVKIRNGPSLLYCAIVQGDLDIARMIVEAGYNVSKDVKVRQEYKGETLTRNTCLIEWLKSELQAPSSLQRQCRSTIRCIISSSHNGTYFKTNLLQLPLPKSILTYLLLQDDGDAYL